METLIQNLRHALRRIRHHKVYSATILLCLALGIGANTAIFSMVNTLLFRPLPVADVDRLTFVLDMREWTDPFEAALVDYLFFTRDGASFAGVGIAHRESFNLLGGDRPERVEAAAVSRDYLTTLGVEPLHGRGFSAEEDRPGGPPVALVGHGLWQRRFGGDPALLGSTLTLDAGVYTVVGILPPEFDLPLGTELWVPLGLDVESLPMDEQIASDYLMVARLKEGVSLRQGNAEAATLARQISQTYPEREGWGIKMIPLRQQLLGDINGKVRPALLLVLALVGLLLLITCANVASLLLVRSLERRHEVAVQVFLGATRWRLAGQLLTESVMLALMGGVAGLVLAYWATPPLMSLSPVQAFSLQELFATPKIDGRVLGFAFLVSLVTGVIFGLVPALRTSMSESLALQLKEGGRASSGRGERRLLAGLVVAEITLAVILLLGAGLTFNSFRALQRTDLGFAPENKLAMEIFLPSSKYPEHHHRVAFFERLLERVRSLPGVRQAATTTTIPLAIAAWDAPYTVEGTTPTQSSEVPIASHRLVSPGYLEMMGISLAEGRAVAEQDRGESLPSVVISRELARRAWPGESALGKRFQLGYPPTEDDPMLTVVGVVNDVKEDRFNFGIDRPVWYLPYFRIPTGLPSVSLVVQSDGNVEELIPGLRQAVWEIDKDQPIAEIITLGEHLRQFLGPQRFSVVLVGGLAVVGLLLAAVGLYGLISYSVAQETRELGIRMALGAQSGDLLRLALGRGLLLALFGLILGLTGGWGLSQLLASQVEQLRGSSPAIFLLIAGVLLLVALVATYLPARRTTRIDPLAALRYE